MTKQPTISVQTSSGLTTIAQDTTTTQPETTIPEITTTEADSTSTQQSTTELTTTAASSPSQVWVIEGDEEQWTHAMPLCPIV